MKTCRALAGKAQKKGQDVARKSQKWQVRETEKERKVFIIKERTDMIGRQYKTDGEKSMKE